jgi:hypothetical protein
MIWLGGMYPAYVHHIKTNNVFWSCWNAVFWPIDYGMWLADIYEEEETNDL